MERPRLLLQPWKEDACFGDCIQEARLIPYLAPYCHGRTLVTHRELARLFSRLGFPVVTFADVTETERSLWGAHIVSFQPSHIACFIPRGAHWPEIGHTELGTLWADDSVRFNPDPSRLQVGLCWQGSGRKRSGPLSEDDPRSIPRSMLAPILKVPGVQFTSLQLPDLARLGVWDFAGTAAAVKRLDLVITVDTSVAHLAGSLGIPTWLLLLSPQMQGFWDEPRWNRTRPLYQSVRQFRQTAPGDWSAVIEEVESELGSFERRDFLDGGIGGGIGGKLASISHS